MYQFIVYITSQRGRAAVQPWQSATVAAQHGAASAPAPKVPAVARPRGGVCGPNTALVILTGASRSLVHEVHVITPRWSWHPAAQESSHILALHGAAHQLQGGLVRELSQVQSPRVVHEFDTNRHCASTSSSVTGIDSRMHRLSVKCMVARSNDP